jgi:peptidylprolyl isomerase
LDKMKTTLAALFLTATPLLAAQTTTAKPPVHHTTTAAASPHRVVAKSTCAVPLPTLSPKIPALPATAPKCPAVQYQLSYIDTKIGTGELAAPKKWYTVHYTGYLPDGTKFDSSLDRGEPITFPYGAHRVITGWDTGFDGMRVGGKRRLFVPYQLAYGDAGRPPVIPEKAELIFDVEFVSQSDTPPAPKTPPAPPAGAPKPPTPPSGTTPAPAPAPGSATPPPPPATAPAAKPAPPTTPPATITTPPKQ